MSDSEAHAKPFFESLQSSLAQNLKLSLSVVLGSATLTVEELLKLLPGDVIKLNRRVEDPLEIRINGTPFAHGELVLSEGRVSIRITGKYQG